jgi:signal transduction histidine kinase
MKRRITISIKQRIYWSFSLLVLLFVINGIITILTLNSNKKLAIDIFKIIAPSIQTLDDFNKMMLESKMYTTNWVYLRTNQEDKNSLKKLHDFDYAALKSRINVYSSQWTDKTWLDSINSIYTGFGELLAIEKNIMGSLKEFSDYDDPVIKLEAERKVEEEILPRTAALINSLNAIHDFQVSVRARTGNELERSSMKLRILIIILVFTIILSGLLLSVYMTKVIIGPVNRIRHIINNLGRGIIQKIEAPANDDEIGRMVNSVNNLSEKLQAAASFAHETGQRNFHMPFTSLSDEDTLGKALLAMRENLKTGEANLEIQNKELERKNKELEQFAYVASHDLQEPLRTTSSFVELFQQQYQGKLDDKADKYLVYITQSVTRMKVLIADLLDYSRIGSKKELKRVDCNIVLNEVLADLDTAIKETGAEITACQLPVISGYQTELKQLFQNLLLNSIKFRQKKIRPLITICAWKNTDSWQFAFSDNGIGIPKEHFERIFIIFQRLHTRNEYNGSGIGLSHCKKIVELHKGKIWLESEPGKGTTFYFTIPQKKTIKNETAISLHTGD